MENTKVKVAGVDSKAAKQEEVIDMAAHLSLAADRYASTRCNVPSCCRHLHLSTGCLTHRFQVAQLRELATNATAASLTAENVADRWAMADACQSATLKASILLALFCA